MDKDLLVTINTIEKVNRFVKIANEFDCDIDVISERYVLNAKSILGILSLNLLEPIKVVVHSSNKEIVEKFNESMEEFK